MILLCHKEVFFGGHLPDLFVFEDGLEKWGAHYNYTGAHYTRVNTVSSFSSPLYIVDESCCYSKLDY